MFPFIGRLDDTLYDGLNLDFTNLDHIYDNYDFSELKSFGLRLVEYNARDSIVQVRWCRCYDGRLSVIEGL